MALDTTLIELNDGTQICAPADIQLMTNFVLREQGDWFEDEIDFVREYIQPGMHALDIGANYGLYTTAMAKQLGEQGKLWCFEPTPDTASALRNTISANNFAADIQVIEAGLSDHEGEATFYTSPNAELNSLSAADSLTGEKQTIALRTLDNCFEEFQWPQLDFIKLDAEGEELNILKSASKTFEHCSPLVMFELKHLDKINMPLINAFRELGFDSYILIPGLNILAPFDENAELDGYQLNLFCCKPDLVSKLEERGLLARDTEAMDAPEDVKVDDFLKSLPAMKTISFSLKTDETYARALRAFVAAQDSTVSPSRRVQYLNQAFEIARNAMNNNETRIGRLASYARIAMDAGKRDFGLQILGYTIENFFRTGRPFELNEPFLPVSPVFQTMDSGANPRAWFAASILDQYVRKHAFSSYFTAGKALPYLAQMRSMGYLTADMDKREKLINERLQTA